MAETLTAAGLQGGVLYDESDVNDVSISKPSKGILSGASIASKTAEVLTATGLKTGALYDEIAIYRHTINTNLLCS